MIRLEGEPTEEALEAAVRAALGDQVSDEAKWMKTTLAIGGKEDGLQSPAPGRLGRGRRAMLRDVGLVGRLRAR